MIAIKSGFNSDKNERGNYVKIPSYVKTAMELLEKAGFEAFAVGGCVRDSLLGKTPDDWDLCTNALPDEICDVFKAFHVIKTGVKHGTVTVRVEHNSVEITTYRSDGEYSDHRRPEAVRFVTSIEQDLSRRDFTINALAYSQKSGITDLFEGKKDLDNRIIRCVGNPEKRFDEDALRILRALRFASVLDFEIEKDTAAAIHAMKGLLDEISAERIREELLKLLCGKGVVRILDGFGDVIAQIIPEISQEFGFLQNNPHHAYDVYTHTIKAVENIRENRVLRLVMLLHDIGKPTVFKADENGIGHFKKHQSVGADMADKILKRLRFDNKTRVYVVNQIAEHDNRFPPTRKCVRRFVSQHGFDFFFEHLEIRLADTMAQSDYCRENKLFELEEKKRIGLELISENAKLSLGELEINGRHLIDMGFLQGKNLKIILESCLERVVDESLENKREALEKYVLCEFSHLKEKD